MINEIQGLARVAKRDYGGAHKIMVVDHDESVVLDIETAQVSKLTPAQAKVLAAQLVRSANRALARKPPKK